MSCWCKWRILQKKKSKSGEQKWRVTFMRWSDFIFIWGFAVRKIEGSPDCSEPIKSRIPSVWLSGHLGAKVTCRHQWPPGAARAQLCHRSSERFLFNKNSGLKFWKFHSLNGIIQSAELIWPKPLNVWHRMQKSSTGDNNFVKMERGNEMTRLVKVDHLQRGLQLFWSDRTWMVCSIWSPREISIILSWMENTKCNVCPTPWQLTFKFLHSLGNSRDETPRMGPWECWELSRLI